MSLISSLSSSTFYQCITVIFICFIDLTSASNFLSDGVFYSSGASTRTLLQSTKIESCTLDFEHANYTILNSECKGPDYPPARCCEAFKHFACPYSNEINDMNTDCATLMFKYIDRNGNFPPDYFVNECQAIDCSSVLPASKTVNSTVNSTAHVSANRATFVVAAVSMVSLLKIL